VKAALQQRYVYDSHHSHTHTYHDPVMRFVPRGRNGLIFLRPLPGVCDHLHNGVEGPATANDEAAGTAERLFERSYCSGLDDDLSEYLGVLLGAERRKLIAIA
jgi:hypothetical protein